MQWHRAEISGVERHEMACGMHIAPILQIFLFISPLLFYLCRVCADMQTQVRQNANSGIRDVTLKHEIKKNKSFQFLDLQESKDFIYRVCGSGQWASSHINM